MSCVLSVLLFGRVMQVCLGALLCRRHRYTAYRQLVRLCWGYLGKAIRVPTPSSTGLRIREEYPSHGYGGFHEVQVWLSYCASASSTLKRLLYSLTACALSGLSILDVRVGGSYRSSGLSALDLMHTSITSCIRSSSTLKNTSHISL